MSVHTTSQRLAQAAFPRIRDRHPTMSENENAKLSEKPFREYVSFAKKFPALIHTCGLAQAVAFALAKKETDYLTDLTEVVAANGHSELTGPESLDHHARIQPLSSYLRLSRDVITAAGWLKRYVEAVVEGT